ncbi:hypothetical protein [Polycladidibacter stylochi]|uniref:hypothetical protein n=1 Tax=Polycladidibacter stylochi TaxID=1807766 RepID=UPI00082F2193|nr:hypothetical protein [Pseudovibrio stylochi]
MNATESVSIEAQREAIVAEAIRPVAAELRLVELTSLARHVLGNETANLEDLIGSSSELYFKQDTLKFASTSTIDISWSGETSICLHMSFANRGVCILFHLILLPLNSAVEVKYIAFDNPSEEPLINTQRLKEALDDAKKNIN